MEYKRRNISLPPELDEKLRNEVSASGTVAQALIAHYQYKDNLRHLAGNINILNNHLERLQAPKQQEDKQQFVYKSLVPGRPAVKVDTYNETYYDPYIKQWKLISEIEA